MEKSAIVRVVDVDMNGQLFPAGVYAGNICVGDYLTVTDDCLEFTVEVLSAGNNAPAFTTALNDMIRTFDHNCPDDDDVFYGDVEFPSVGVFDSDIPVMPFKWPEAV
mgnify:CR=1 FL=1